VREADEGALGGDHFQAGALHGDQQARLARMRVEPITEPAVLLQRGDGAGVQDELAGLAVLTAHHRQGGVVRIEVVTVQAVGLAGPQAGHGQQPDQRLVGQRGRPVAHPPSGLLWRRMVLWNVTVYGQGLHLEYEHLHAVSGLQQRYGRWAWRWKAPLAERLALRLQPAQTSLTRTYDSDAMGRYDQEPYGRGRLGAGQPAAIRTGDEVLAAARRILADADRQGVRLSNANLARLRDEGHTIANRRISELAEAARDDATRHGV
jgi:hypothetical protein